MHLIWAFYEPGAAPPFVPKFTHAEVTTAFGVAAAHPLGAGAFGETWKITDAAGQHRAAKIIVDPNYPPQVLDREVQGLRSVKSDHVVDLIDAHAVTIAGHDRMALEFEYIDGGDLASHLTPGVGFDADQVRHLAQGLLTGVGELHARQTVHRDIKPENIALRGGDLTQPVLLDLGLAKVLDQQTLTVYPQLIGTVPFMSPEQLRGEKARQLADLFGVGVVLHLALTGTHPFYGPASQRLDHGAAIRRLDAGPTPLPAHVPADLASVATRLLEPTAYRRGSAARALADLT